MRCRSGRPSRAGHAYPARCLWSRAGCSYPSVVMAPGRGHTGNVVRLWLRLSRRSRRALASPTRSAAAAARGRCGRPPGLPPSEQPPCAGLAYPGGKRGPADAECVRRSSRVALRSRATGFEPWWRAGRPTRAAARWSRLPATGGRALALPIRRPSSRPGRGYMVNAVARWLRLHTPEPSRAFPPCRRFAAVVPRGSLDSAASSLWGRGAYFGCRRGARCRRPPHVCAQRALVLPLIQQRAVARWLCYVA